MSLAIFDDWELLCRREKRGVDLPRRRVLCALVARPVPCYDRDGVFCFEQGNCGLQADYASAGEVSPGDGCVGGGARLIGLGCGYPMTITCCAMISYKAIDCG